MALPISFYLVLVDQLKYVVITSILDSVTDFQCSFEPGEVGFCVYLMFC